ncbi:MAG: hypothetical protein KJ556_21360 [Gammaproteobacteria bacterium]|nr:hypothetical protein [Gammaproteobacteria bacterium]
MADNMTFQEFYNIMDKRVDKLEACVVDKFGVLNDRMVDIAVVMGKIDTRLDNGAKRFEAMAAAEIKQEIQIRKLEDEALAARSRFSLVAKIFGGVFLLLQLGLAVLVLLK